MSYNHQFNDDMLAAPPPPRISKPAGTEATAAYPPYGGESNTSVRPYDYGRSRDDRFDRRPRYEDDSMHRDRRERMPSNHHSQRRDDRVRGSPFAEDFRSDRSSRMRSKRSRSRDRDRDRNDRTNQRRHRSRTRSRSRQRRNNDNDYQRSGHNRRRNRSSSRDRSGRQRSRTPSNRRRHNERASASSSTAIYRSKPLALSTTGNAYNTEMVDFNRDKSISGESKHDSDTYTEQYDGYSGDETDVLNKKQIHEEMAERLRRHLASEGKVYPPPKAQPAFVNDGSFLERFKQMQEQQQQFTESVKPPEVMTLPKPVPLPVFGKRRGGKILKTGMVAKRKPVEEADHEKGTDAWSQYLREVQQYKNVVCEVDGITRCLVK